MKKIFRFKAMCFIMAIIMISLMATPVVAISEFDNTTYYDCEDCEHSEYAISGREVISIELEADVYEAFQINGELPQSIQDEVDKSINEYHGINSTSSSVCGVAGCNAGTYNVLIFEGNWVTSTHSIGMLWWKEDCTITSQTRTWGYYCNAGHSLGTMSVVIEIHSKC